MLCQFSSSHLLHENLVNFHHTPPVKEEELFVDQAYNAKKEQRRRRPRQKTREGDPRSRPPNPTASNRRNLREFAPLSRSGWVFDDFPEKIKAGTCWWATIWTMKKNPIWFPEESHIRNTTRGRTVIHQSQQTL